MSLEQIAITPASTDGWFLLATRDLLGTDDEQLLRADELERLRAAIDAVLPRGEHSHAPNDPDTHVIFPSVCCGAQLYRCSALVEGLPSKPIIRHGEDACRSCGEPLAQF